MNNHVSVGTKEYLYHEPEMKYYVVVDTVPFLVGSNIISHEIFMKELYTIPPEAYWHGTLIVPPSTKTKGNHAYPFYHKGKW